jgi:hypothetical protein
MNSIQKPQHGCANLSDADTSHPATLTSVQSLMFSPEICGSITNAISLPELGDGPLPSSSPTGPKIDPCGQAPALASLSATLESNLEQQTLDIFGLNSNASSKSAALQVSLASRLRARLAAYGSTEYELTWKEWDMESGGPICALRASEAHRSGNAYSGWQSPVASEARQGFQDRTRGKKGTQISLTTQVILNVFGKTPKRSGAKMGGRGVLNPAFSRWLMGYPAAWDSCGATAMQSVRSSRRSSSSQ